MQEQEIPLREKGIVFIGFMGVGKTTIGKLVAKKLKRIFIDTDEEIERIYGMPVKEIFTKMGETEFRKKEKEYIEEVIHQRLNVLSLGGGAFLQEKIRDICIKNSIVVFIDMSWDKWVDRLELIVDSRPILKNRSLEEIEVLFYERQKFYSNHHCKLNIDDLEPEQAANTIVECIRSYWE